jgi:hypothetical protein
LCTDHAHKALEMISADEQVGRPAIRDHNKNRRLATRLDGMHAVALTPLPRRVPGLVGQRRRADAALGVRQSVHTISKGTSASIRRA